MAKELLVIAPISANRKYPAYGISQFGVNPTNVGYELHLDGGSLINFNLPGFGAAWLNEITVRFNLPDPGVTDTGNKHFDTIGKIIRTLAAGGVPFENMVDDDTPYQEVQKALCAAADWLDVQYGVDKIPAMKEEWIFCWPGEPMTPARLRITPVLRDTLVSPRPSQTVLLQEKASRVFAAGQSKTLEKPMVEGDAIEALGQVEEIYEEPVTDEYEFTVLSPDGWIAVPANQVGVLKPGVVVNVVRGEGIDQAYDFKTIEKVEVAGGEDGKITFEEVRAGFGTMADTSAYHNWRAAGAPIVRLVFANNEQYKFCTGDVVRVVGVSPLTKPVDYSAAAVE